MSFGRHHHSPQYSETEYTTVVTEVDRTAAFERPCYAVAAPAQQQHTFRTEVYEQEVDGGRYEVYEKTCEEDVETDAGEYVQRERSFLVKAT